MIYTTGTIAVNGNTLTGTGTNFTAAGSLIRIGCTVLTMTSPPQAFQITGITSGTVMTVSPAASPALAAGTKYSILLSDSLSVDGLAQDIAEVSKMYLGNISGFVDVMNATGDVNITVGGKAVTVPGQKSLAKKGANQDITSLAGLTTPLSVGQGGTGMNRAYTAAELRTNAGLGTAATMDATINQTDTTPGRLLRVADYGLGGEAAPGIPGGNYGSITRSGFCGGPGAGTVIDGPPTIPDGNPIYGALISAFRSPTEGFIITAHSRACMFRTKTSGVWQQYQQFYTTANTTKAADGTLKSASPVVKIFHDGRAETNDESEGCAVNRLGVGQYLIKNCMGLNSDAAWSGIDGGFDIPCDRHKRVRIWLDYKVNADGSILVKTYHCTYPESPEFAQNRIGYKDENGVFTETVTNGEPVDIPADQYLLVRVEMPENSIWNQKQAAIQAEIEAAQEE